MNDTAHALRNRVQSLSERVYELIEENELLTKENESLRKMLRNTAVHINERNDYDSAL